MKRDPGVNGENPLFFGFARGTTPAPLVIEPKTATLAGRPGAAEPVLRLEWGTEPHSNGPELSIRLGGWLIQRLDLNQRQAAYLRDRLNEWLPSDTTVRCSTCASCGYQDPLRITASCPECGSTVWALP